MVLRCLKKKKNVFFVCDGSHFLGFGFGFVSIEVVFWWFLILSGVLSGGGGSVIVGGIGW